MLMSRTRPEPGRGAAIDAARQQQTREQVLEAINELWECFRELTANNTGDAEKRLHTMGKFATALSTLTQQAPNLHAPIHDIHHIETLINDPYPPSYPGRNDIIPPNKAMFVQLTPKQHAVIQMVLRGATNVEIAERLGWSESTAKGSIHNLARKFLAPVGAKRYDRVGLDHIIRPLFEAMTPQDYEKVASIPKNWDAKWTEADRTIRPYLYERRNK